MNLGVEQFEYLKPSETTALLRLSGRWTGAGPGECKLVASSGGTRLVLEPLPHPPGQSDPWRSAYSAPLKRVERGRTRFSLHSPAGEAIALPQPGAHGKPAPARRAAPARPSVLDRLLKARDTRALAQEHRRALARERKARTQAERAVKRER